MKLQLASAREGALWVRSAFRIFFRRPVAFCALFVVYMVAAQLLVLLWPVGPVAVLMMMPLASLGFMIATRSALEGRFPLPSVFIEPLRSREAVFQVVVKYPGQAKYGVQFIKGAIGFNAGSIFGNFLAANKLSEAFVTGAGVHFGNANSHGG